MCRWKWASLLAAGLAAPLPAVAAWVGLASEVLGKPVVADLRSSDMFHGGEGAPIVPFAHWFFTPSEHSGRLVVNIGGIANVTHVVDELEQVRGYDVGPGMMIADHLSRKISGGDLDCDRDGVLSRGGRVIEGVIDHVFAHPFFVKQPPRSTGREDFGQDYAERLRGLYFSPERMPGPHLRTSVELVEAIPFAAELRKEYDATYQSFVDEFNVWDDGKASARFVDEVFG